MSSIRFEAFLARLYVDSAARRAFLADRRATAKEAGLTPDEVEALATIDTVGFEMAAASFEAKRARAPRTWRRGMRWLRILRGSAW